MTPLSDRDDRARAVLGSALAVVGLVMADVVGVLSRRPTTSVDEALLGFAWVGLGCGLVLAVPAVALRREIRALASARGGVLGRAAAGAIDALVLFVLLVHIQAPRAFEGKHTLIVVGAVLVGVLLGVFTSRDSVWSRRAGLALAVLVAAIAVQQLATLRWNGHLPLRVGLHAALAASVAALVGPVTRRLSARVSILAVVALGAIGVLSAGPLLDASRGARTILHRRSSHAQSWAFVLASIADLDRDGAANVLGGRDCDPARGDVSPIGTEIPGDALDANCANGPGRALDRPRNAAPGQGAAVGHDVLVLSIDSLRADLMDALVETSAVLGPHATFSHAVSPSPMTRFSLSSTLRGRPVRQLRFESDPNDTLAVLRHDRSPTLGHVLTENGYRAVSVATTDHLDAATRVAAGFHTLDVTGYGAPPWRAQWPRRGKWFYRAPDALALLMRAARSTRGPLVSWTHLMDSHYPYYRGEVAGSFDLAGLRASVRDLDHRVAAFLRAYVAVRRRAPVVVIFGDHGEAFGDHGTTHHASATYAEQVRVGALLAGPGVRAGRFDAPMTTTALVPSVLELVGVPPPRTMEPSLLRPMNDRGAWPEVAVTELRHAAPHRVEVGYMTERWHLVRDAVHDVDELFDLTRDPRETRDVLLEEPGAAAAMSRLAARWDESH